MLMVGTLKTTRCFTVDHYDTLITKCALHGAKLLKKPDQCRAVYACSHLWWGTMIAGQQEDGEEVAQPYHDGKRVLECLQKALKIADSCMDSVTNVELFVEILNRYIYYFEKKNESVCGQCTQVQVWGRGRRRGGKAKDVHLHLVYTCHVCRPCCAWFHLWVSDCHQGQKKKKKERDRYTDHDRSGVVQRRWFIVYSFLTRLRSST